MTHSTTPDQDSILLSKYTESLIAAVLLSKTKKRTVKGEPIQVSEAVSFFAFAYEKLRNSVEFNEQHLIRRTAISRILRRRFSVNPKAYEEGDNLLRELLWANYLDKGTVSKYDALTIQTIINSYLVIINSLKSTPGYNHKYVETLVDFLACEIEEALFPDVAIRKMAYVFFLYQVLVSKISGDNISSQLLGNYFYISCEAELLKNDDTFIKYHLFINQHQSPTVVNQQNLDKFINKLPSLLDDIEIKTKNPYRDKLNRFIRRQKPPFLILYHLIEKYPDIKVVLTSKANLKNAVTKECNLHYQETQSRLKTAGIRSIVYVFLTKMLFVLLLEVPLTSRLYGHIDLLSISINTIFPPSLMGLIVTFVNPPTQDNTARINMRIENIINVDPKFETEKTINLGSRARNKRPILLAVFTGIYTISFGLILFTIWFFLDALNFNILSKLIFFFFVSVVTFFGYRVRQIAKEYALQLREPALSPFVDLFFLPILSLGRILSRHLSKINIIMFAFDVLIEAPFKLIIDIVEEWFKFIRRQKEEML